jgi:hypothetical protein
MKPYNLSGGGKRTPPDVYETLFANLYANRSGMIGFLDLLDMFEQILHNKTTANQPSAYPRYDRIVLGVVYLHQTELMDSDGRLRRRVAVSTFLVVH